MTLGEKLRQARAARGLSQARVAGTHMTRNMLSQLEHDLASPSVKTLLYLAETLGVSAGWLLDEKATADSFLITEQAKDAYRRGAYAGCLELLSGVEGTLDDEQGLLLFRSAVSCGEQALTAGKLSEADRFLRAADQSRSLYVEKADLLSVRKLRLRLALAQGEPDDVLMQEVLESWDPDEVGKLAALHDLLRGRLAAEDGRIEEALPYLHRAETSGMLPVLEQRSLNKLLELCYKSKEDYKLAYYYATLQSGRE